MPFNARMEAMSRLSGKAPSNSIDAVSWLERRSRANLSTGQKFARSAQQTYQKGISRGFGALGRTAMHPVGGTALLGGVFAAASHDNTKNSFGSHMAQEGLKVGGDALMEGALFGVGALVGGPIGMGIGIVGSIAAYGMGFNPGAIIGKSMEGAKQAYKKQLNGGIAPITQNKRTMEATAQNLRMLGQSSGKFSMLGHEAQYMHN